MPWSSSRASSTVNSRSSVAQPIKAPAPVGVRGLQLPPLDDQGPGVPEHLRVVVGRLTGHQVGKLPPQRGPPLWLPICACRCLSVPERPGPTPGAPAAGRARPRAPSRRPRTAVRPLLRSLPSASTRPLTSVTRPSRLSLRSRCSTEGEPPPSSSAFPNAPRHPPGQPALLHAGGQRPVVHVQRLSGLHDPLVLHQLAQERHQAHLLHVLDTPALLEHRLSRTHRSDLLACKNATFTLDHATPPRHPRPAQTHLPTTAHATADRNVPASQSVHCLPPVGGCFTPVSACPRPDLHFCNPRRFSVHPDDITEGGVRPRACRGAHVSTPPGAHM